MSYLDYAEFKAMSNRDIDEQTFDKLLTKSSAVLDNVTNHFYQRNSISKDNIWRVNKFKEALTSQIDYFDILGATTYEEINSSPQTFSAGRTSVSNASRYKASGTNETKQVLSDDVYLYLEGTGLIYRGVAIW